jgi:hypothetical protein
MAPALLPLLLLAGAPPAPGVELPARAGGGVTARLWVSVPEQGPAPGRGRARLTLSVEGPPALQVDGPRLEDALAGWRVAWRASSWAADGHARLEITLGLVQVKPGVVPLPGVHLRVRAGPEGDWHDLSWPELLGEPRDVPPPVELPPLPPSPWPRLLGTLALLLAGAVAAPLLARAWRRWRAGPGRPAPAWQRALARLAEAREMAQLTGVVRGFLEEQAGLPATRLTTGELFAGLEGRGAPPVALAGLRELFALGDLEKFAGQPAGPEQVEAARAQARGVIEALVGWPGQAGEGERPGKSDPAREGG